MKAFSSLKVKLFNSGSGELQPNNALHRKHGRRTRSRLGGKPAPKKECSCYQCVQGRANSPDRTRYLPSRAREEQPRFLLLEGPVVTSLPSCFKLLLAFFVWLKVNTGSSAVLLAEAPCLGCVLCCHSCGKASCSPLKWELCRFPPRG